MLIYFFYNRAETFFQTLRIKIVNCKVPLLCNNSNQAAFPKIKA